MVPKVSIIMPVYNAADTIACMVDSIIAQTMTDWELLAVDDGSTDGSSRILDDYATMDNRVRVFHKENEGVAKARQLGVDNAIGEYSIHADSDDWVEPEMLENMLKKAKNEDADILLVDYYTESIVSGNKYVNQTPSSLESKVVLNDVFHGKVFAGLPFKLIRHSLYKRYNVSFFKDVNYCEDVLICAQLLRHSDIKVAYLPEAYYHYVMNDSSLTHRISRKTYEGLLLYLQKLEEFLYAPEWKNCVEKAYIGVFLESFKTKGVMTNTEVSSFFRKIENVAFSNPSIRWKIGYFMVKVGCFSIARGLLKY